jgi:hypothetical protein
MLNKHSSFTWISTTASSLSPCPPPGPLSCQMHSTSKNRFLKRTPDFSHPSLNSFRGPALRARYNPNALVCYTRALVIHLTQFRPTAHCPFSPFMYHFVPIYSLVFLCTHCVNYFSHTCLSYSPIWKAQFAGIVFWKPSLTAAWVPKSDLNACFLRVCNTALL